MLGISYGELFLLIGVTAAVVGTKDLPKIGRTAGRLTGRAIGYVQLARGQFENVMQQSQARQVHKELQDTMAQLEAIRHEMRSISLMNPGPMTRNLMDNAPNSSPQSNGNSSFEKQNEEQKSADTFVKDGSLTSDSNNLHSQASATTDSINLHKQAIVTTGSVNLHSQATAYAKMAESHNLKSTPLTNSTEKGKLEDQGFSFTLLPVSAESIGMLPNRKGGECDEMTENTNGSDIVLEAVLEAEVARNAKNFFSHPENQIQ